VSLPLLVIGGDGLIGRALVTYCYDVGQPVIATSLSDRASSMIQLDLETGKWPSFPKCLGAVICAAITRQDLCRQDPEGTRKINVVRTFELAKALADSGTFVTFLSTNLVFDGSQPCQLADAPASPETEYGRQKAEAEARLASLGNQAAIIRLTKVFHPKLPILLSWERELSTARPIRAFSDYFCSPISLSQVVAGITRITAEQIAGIWQFSGQDDVSYAQLALWHARAWGKESLVASEPTPPGLLEHLPAHTTLDAGRAARELSLQFPPAQQVLSDCISTAISAGRNAAQG
jgi:dTDP-4-dehydrorhamnose reductase